MRSIAWHLSLSIAAVIGLEGCSSTAFSPAADGAVPSHKSSPASPAATSAPSPAPSSFDPAGGADSAGASGGAANGGNETEAANQPAQVSGAFLTMGCGHATAADGAVATAGSETYGCEILNNNGNRYSGAVSVTTIKIAFVADASVIPPPRPAATGSKWHVIFPVAAGKIGEITSFEAIGTANGVGFDLSEAIKPTANAACPGNRYVEAHTGLKAAIMDAASSDAGGNGLPPLRIFADRGFAEGDVLLNTSVASNKIAIPEIQNGVTVLTQPCPNLWRIYFRDAAGKLLPNPQPNVTDYNAGQVVPTGAASAWLGFWEPVVGQYGDNEGMPGVPTPANSTNGCDFQFELARAQCGG